MSAAKVNAFVNAFMVKAKDAVDDAAYDAIIALWEGVENQEQLAETFTTKRRSAKKTKKLKDKNAPKRGKSAYIFFCAKMRPQAKENLGGEASLGEVGKELGRLWNQIKNDSVEVNEYKILAYEDKMRYEKEMRTYVRPSDEELEEQQSKKKGKGKGKGKRKSSGKKRGKSAYMFFCAEMRPKIKEEHEDFSPKEVMSELGKRWQEAKQGDTSKWDELAKQDKEEKASSSEAEAEKVSSSEEDSTKQDESEDELVEEEDDAPKEKKGVWKSKVDKKSGKTYYYNTATKETSWDKPGDMPEEEEESPKKSSPKKSSPKKSSTKKKSTGKRIYAAAFWKKTHKEAIAEETGTSGAELVKELSKRWKALSKEEQAEWKEKAAKA